MAQKVNSALKGLINETDDSDFTIDVDDEIKMKLLSSPVTSSHASFHTQDSADAVASDTSTSTSEGVAEGGARKEEEGEEVGAGRPRAFAREEQQVAIKFSLLPVMGEPTYFIREIGMCACWFAAGPDGSNGREPLA